MTDKLEKRQSVDRLDKKLSASKVIAKKARAGQSPRNSLDNLALELGSKDSQDHDEKQNNDLSEEDYSAEYDVDHPTGDRTRDKVRKLLTDAMFQEGENIVDNRSAAETASNAIENAMFTKFNGNGAPYKSKYRNISFNLKDKKNSPLRMAVLKRFIPPSKLLEMSNEDLANEELKINREKVHEKMTRDAMPYNKQEASTDMFRCGKCKERKCNYYQMQTRSADEPLTTFVSCVNCGNRWRF